MMMIKSYKYTRQIARTKINKNTKKKKTKIKIKEKQKPLLLLVILTQLWTPVTKLNLYANTIKEKERIKESRKNER